MVLSIDPVIIVSLCIIAPESIISIADTPETRVSPEIRTAIIALFIVGKVKK
jgi:hypothetical protein